MTSQLPSKTHFTLRHFGLLAVIAAVVLLGALGMLAWSAAQRLDSMVLAEENRDIAAGLAQERSRLIGEQKILTKRNAAVINLRASNRVWIVENLSAATDELQSDDHAYVVRADGAVMRLFDDGGNWGVDLDANDVEAVEPLLVDIRRLMAGVATGVSTPPLADIGVADLVRLPSGKLAMVSVQPVVGTSLAAWQRSGTEFLHVVLRIIDAGVLADLAERAGVMDLRVAVPSGAQASLALKRADGRPVGYLVWTPSRPALKLLGDSLPALAGMLALGILGMGALFVWLRTAAAQLQASREQTSFLAFHDPLTGLANRVLFRSSLETAMGYEYLAATKVLLVSIDLDRFKEVNDTLGHAAGDELLGQVGKRLSQALSDGATLARLAGDEFAIVQPGIVSDGHARWLCQSMLQSLKQPFMLSSGPLHVTASFGAALEPGDSLSPQEMLRRADVALYAAKAAGSNCFEIYAPDMDRNRRDKRTLEVDLRHALISDTGLFLLYQPVFDARTGKIVGAEALVRWLHPTRGYLAPDVFIGIAEETGIIDALGLWVLDQASRFAAASGLCRIAVNVSPIQFLDSAFNDHVLQTLRRHDLAPSRLELEITEGLLLQNSSQVRQTLVQLRNAGASIALDDFGTGYSSISYLRTHNVDKLKIDQSFTRLMNDDQPTQAIVRSVIEMAHALGMSVTAEGVEDESQRRLLQALGCNYLQGYLLSRPVTGERLIELLAADQAAPVLPAAEKTA